MAEQQNKFIHIVKQGNTEDLKTLLNLVADEIVSYTPINKYMATLLKNITKTILF